MTTISEKRIRSTEPIETVLGRTEAGDWLLQDRNGKNLALRQALLDEWAPSSNGATRPEPEPEPETVPEPVPAKRKRRKAAA